MQMRKETAAIVPREALLTMPAAVPTPFFDTLSPDLRPLRQAQVQSSSRPSGRGGHAKIVEPLIDNDMPHGFAFRLDGTAGMAPR